jgi:crotonobetainyl-CoA:carnitine CoA-transferase CaiB-like acyl-CoA transferase
VQAEGGLMSVTGAADGPPFRLGVAIADLVAGLLAAQGITLALFARQRTGRGQRVDIGMLDGVAALLSYQAGIFFATGDAPPRMGNRHPTIVPYETFEALDGEFVLAVGNDEQFRRFCSVAGLDTLAADERFATNSGRVVHYQAFRPVLADALRRRTRAHWIDTLTAAGVPCGSVRDVREVLTDPHLEARRMIEVVEHVAAGPLRVLGVPIKLSDTPGRVRTAPPMLGQHTEAVLTRDLGIAADDIAALRQKGVV